MARRHTRRTKGTQPGLPNAQDCTAIYARVSTDRQATEGNGLEAQRAQLDAACNHKGWAICPDHIYIDAGVSGKSTARPEYQRMLAAVAAGAVQRIVATKLDRLARNTRDFLELVDYCKGHGCALVVLDLDLDTGTPNGELVATVMAGIAQWERQLIRERVKSGKRVTAAQGKYNGSVVPFGYIYDGGAWQIAEAAADTVRRTFDLFLAGGSLRGVAAQLNAEGRTSARGKGWTAVTVGYLLDNGRYAGLEQWHDEDTGTRYEVQGHAPAIVTPDTYERAHARLAQLRRGNPNFGKR